MWDARSLKELRSKAKDWFAPIGLETPLELFERLYEFPLHSIHKAAFKELVTDPSVVIVKNAYISNTLLDVKLDVQSNSLGKKAIARITKDLNIRQSKFESGSFFFQLKSSDNFVLTHELSAYLIEGRETLLWTFRALVNSLNPGLFFEFREQISDESVKTWIMSEEVAAEAPSFGTCTTNIHIPSIMTVLFYLGEYESGQPRPRGVGPAIYNLGEQAIINSNFSTDPDIDDLFGSQFSVCTNVGYQVTDLTDAAIDFLIAQAPKVLSTIQTKLIEGYANPKNSKFFHKSLGSEKSLPSKPNSSQFLAMGRWIPTSIAEQESTWSAEKYTESMRVEGDKHLALLTEILQKGCGWPFQSAINTIIYSFLIPQGRFDEGVELGTRAIYFPESAETRNAQNNTANCLLKMGNIESAKAMFTDSAESAEQLYGSILDAPSGYWGVVNEAKYFLGVIAESENEIESAIAKYIEVINSEKAHMVLTGGVSTTAVEAELALQRLGVEVEKQDEDLDEDWYFRNDDVGLPYLDYLSGDEEKKKKVEDSEPELFSMFEQLDSYGLLTLWGDWSMDLEQVHSPEALEAVSCQSGFLYFDLSDELSEEELEEQEYIPKRLSIQDEFLPTNESMKYKFNIEGGQCTISAKPPQIFPEIEKGEETEPNILNQHSGIDCNKHNDSKDCYVNQCDASLITLDSGLGDGVYGVAAFDGLDGKVECVIAYFFHPGDHEYVENFLISNDFETPGFLEGQVPFYLGKLKSKGEFYFGDTGSWAMGLDDDTWKLARVEVPADEYLVLGWIDPRSCFDRTFYVGLYRSTMKDYMEKVMNYYPAMKTFAEENIVFERGLSEF